MSGQSCLTDYTSADCISAFGSLGQFIVVLIAFIYTLVSINGWRRPTLAQRRAEVAVDILLNAAKLKDELLFVRRELRLVDALTSRAEIARLRLAELRELEPVVDKLASANIKQRIIMPNAVTDAAVHDFIGVEESLRKALNQLSSDGLGIKECYDEALRFSFETDRETDVIRKKLRKAYEILYRELKGWVDLK